MTTNAPTTPSSSDGWMQWTIILVLLALILSTIVLGQVIAAYSSAYIAAPREVATIIDTVDFSIQENESYDRDVNKVQRLEDKLRLGRLLREIQKTGDNLREELNGLLIDEDTTTLRLSARFMWASKRVQLESAVRRLDLLRMRFLVVYMGIMTSIADKQPPAPPPLPPNPEKMAAFKTPTKPKLKKSFTEDHPKLKVPPRRLTTQAVGHHEHIAGHSRMGWAGVVQELQLSPKLQQRHASIEQHMAMEKTP